MVIVLVQESHLEKHWSRECLIAIRWSQLSGEKNQIIIRRTESDEMGRVQGGMDIDRSTRIKLLSVFLTTIQDIGRQWIFIFISLNKRPLNSECYIFPNIKQMWKFNANFSGMQTMSWKFWHSETYIETVWDELLLIKRCLKESIRASYQLGNF